MSGGSLNYLYRDEGYHPRIDDVKAAMDWLLHEDLDETRAYSAMHSVVRAMKYIVTAFSELEDVFRAVEWHKSSDWGREELVESVEKFADKMCGGDHTIITQDFGRSINIDAWTTFFVIGGKEIRMSGARTTDAGEFFDTVGNEVVQKAKVELLERFRKWKKDMEEPGDAAG